MINPRFSMARSMETGRQSVFTAAVAESTSGVAVWFAVCLIGIGVGLSDSVMTFTIAALHSVKIMLLKQALEVSSSHGVIVVFVLLLFFVVPLVIIACLLVLFVSPMSVGSSLAEVKALLNGSDVPELLSLRTGMCKMLGIVLCIVSGLALGREGPMVHIGSVVACAVMELPYFHKRLVLPQLQRRSQAVFNVESELKSRFITFGGAAGVAAAFKAPISGVLYMLEEMATYWPGT